MLIWQLKKFTLHRPMELIGLVKQKLYTTIGIRAVIIDAECSNPDNSNEIILRDDGGGYDIGYTSAVQLDDGKILIVYYYTETESGPWYS
jgi:sialidase-1